MPPVDVRSLPVDCRCIDGMRCSNSRLHRGRAAQQFTASLVVVGCLAFKQKATGFNFRENRL